ncbi:MAG TPA: branched-chain amino acid ABC transporter permease [Herpetosiphonaceae bacterium]
MALDVPETPPNRRPRARQLGYGGGALLALGLPALLEAAPGLAVSYALYLVCLGLIYGIVALGLNLLVGYAGQISLGHAGFLAIGAYASALLTQRLGWPFWLALPAAGLLAAAVGGLLALPALRVSGPYLAVVTLGFGLTVPQLAVFADSLTGGSGGLREIPPAALPVWYDGTAGLYVFEFASERSFYYLALALTAALALLAARIVASKTGRALRALRDSELAAQAMGVSLARAKTLAFALSAFYAGVAGSLYAHLIRFISPESFTLVQSVEFLAMIVVGGLATIRGPLLGAALLLGLQEGLGRIAFVHENQLLRIGFGVLLILATVSLPHGLAGLRLRRAGAPAKRGFPTAGERRPRASEEPQP